MENNKAIVGISGGVDSAAALITLLENGFDVSGCYVRMLDNSDNDIFRARELCESLSVPFIVKDSRESFKKKVSDEFCRRYCSGLTPNPCILCNPDVKFRSLIEVADLANARHISTGHYAQVVTKEGKYYVGISRNIKKDQSYMLYTLPSEILERLLLPIGNNDKEFNRTLVKERGISLFGAKDSQDICFVPDGDYVGFIHSNGFHGLSGNVLSPEGRILRRHDGIENFTIGQRKGISDNYPGPLFVKDISPNGDIITSFSEGIFSSSAFVEETVVSPGFNVNNNGPLFVKVRYSSGITECIISENTQNSFIVNFKTPVRAATPGQSAVIYSGNLVVAGGIIKKVF